MKLELDKEIYSYEAIKITKSLIDKNNTISIKNKEKTIEITLKNADEKIAKEFINEVLAQQCRIDTCKKNFKIAEIITISAILNSTPSNKKRGD